MVCFAARIRGLIDPCWAGEGECDGGELFPDNGVCGAAKRCHVAVLLGSSYLAAAGRVMLTRLASSEGRPSRVLTCRIVQLEIFIAHI